MFKIVSPLDFLFQWENFSKYLIDKNRELETRNNYVFLLPDNHQKDEWSLDTDEWSLVTLSELFDKINNQRKKKEIEDEQTNDVNQLLEERKKLEEHFISEFERYKNQYYELSKKINFLLKKDVLKNFDEAAKKKSKVDFMNKKSVAISKMYVDEIKWFKYFIDWNEVSQDEYQKKEQEIENMLNN